MVDGTGTHTCYVQWLTVPAHTCIGISLDAFSTCPTTIKRFAFISGRKKYCYRYSIRTDSREAPSLF